MDTDMSAWAAGTRHYSGSTNNYAVEASDVTIPENATRQIGGALALLNVDPNQTTMLARPTVVFECTPEGLAIDLTPVATFPPGTTHEEALAEMGYQVS